MSAVDTKHEAAAVSAGHEAPQPALKAAAAAPCKPPARIGYVCGCMTREGCAVCGKCVERHCVCGVTRSRRVAVCLESRACNCTLEDPSDRCSLCRGCRRRNIRGASHCRCVQHQRQLLRRHQKHVNPVGELDQERCSCFLLANKQAGGREATEEEEKEAARDQHERLRRVKRATGLPSSDSIYRKKIISHLDDRLATDVESGLEEDEEDMSDDLPPTVEDLLPRSMAGQLTGPRSTAPYHPLHRADGTSLLESIEPREEAQHSGQQSAITSLSTQQEILRGLENTAFELDREAALPSDDVVDFLVYMSSVKASYVGELVGTFEDSAAIATGIVLEEYMAQLVEDAAAKRVLCPSMEATVVAFTKQLLMGFNWRLFRQEYVDQDEAMVDSLANLILQEFLAVQARNLETVPLVEVDKLTFWIKCTIMVSGPVSDGNDQVQATTPSMEMSEAAAEPENDGLPSGVETEEKGPALPPPRVRLAVKEDPMLGTPYYKLSFRNSLEDGHEVSVSVREIASKTQATATTTRLTNALKRHYQRHKDLITRRQLMNPKNPLPGKFTSLLKDLNQQVSKFKVSEAGQKALQKSTERKMRAEAEKRKPKKMSASIAAAMKKQREELRVKREARQAKEKERAEALKRARARAAKRALAAMDAKRNLEEQESAKASTEEPSSKKRKTTSDE